MKKLLSMASALLLCFSCLAGCSEKSEPAKETTQASQSTEETTTETQTTTETTAEVETINIVIPKSPVSIPFLRMVEDKTLGENYDVQYKLYSSMEEMSALAMNEEYDFICLAANTASVLYNKGINIKMAGTGVWGGMYLSSTDENVASWKDLKGKTLYIPNRGSVPDIIAQYFLKQAELDITSDVEIVYSTHPEISQLLNTGKINNAVDAEPFATANKKKLNNYNIVSDYIQSWKDNTGDEFVLPNMCICVDGEITDNNSELAKLFNDSYNTATKWTKENPSQASLLAKEYFNMNETLLENAIPNIRFEFKNANDCKNDLNKYYEVLFDLKPECIGGKVPDENFYFTEK